jgi:hypothetical protein
MSLAANSIAQQPPELQEPPLEFVSARPVQPKAAMARPANIFVIIESISSLSQ